MTKPFALRTLYVVMAPPVPARSGYAVRCQTIADTLDGLTTFKLLVLDADDDAKARAATMARYDAAFVTAPPRPKAVKGLVHLRAAAAGRNRWMEKFAGGRLRQEAMAVLTHFEPDLVVAGHAAIAGLLPRFGVAWSNIVVDHHNVETLNYTRMAAVRRGLGKVAPRIDALAFAKIEADCAMALDRWAVSEPDAAALQRIHGAPVAVVPNVAPDPAFAIDPRGTAPKAPAVLGFLGNYHYVPNVDAAIALCAVSQKLAARHPHSLIIMGRDPPPALVGAAGAAGAELTGFVDDAVPHLERFSLTVAPITSGSGTKLKIVETLAMGIPAVTTPVGAEGLPIKEAGIGIVAEGEDALVDACATLLSDRERLADMGVRARAWARENVSMAALREAICASLERVGPHLAERARVPTAPSEPAP